MKIIMTFRLPILGLHQFEAELICDTATGRVQWFALDDKTTELQTEKALQFAIAQLLNETLRSEEEKMHWIVQLAKWQCDKWNEEYAQVRCFSLESFETWLIEALEWTTEEAKRRLADAKRLESF